MTFSGHDTFHCRLFWLKKGYDHLTEFSSFSDDSGVEMGVGKNMVNSIKFWLKAFGVTDEKYNIDPFFKILISDIGFDPYLENEATLYLLHYKLCSQNYSSIYNLMFKELRKIKPEFTKKHFVDFVLDLENNQNKKILEKDFSVFLRTYGTSDDKNIEESYSGLLSELNLLKQVGETQKKEKLYRIENVNQQNISSHVLLYCILSNPNYGDSISFKALFSDSNGVGNIFCFEQGTLEEKLIEITETYNLITYNSEAGIKELQFKQRPNINTVLKACYE